MSWQESVHAWFAYSRPHLGRIVVSIAYALATTGLLILAFHPNPLHDEWAIVGASVATLVLLALLLWTGHGELWLGVGGAWVYAAVIQAIRGPNDLDRAALALIFVAFAVGALGAYTAYRREEPLRG